MDRIVAGFQSTKGKRDSFLADQRRHEVLKNNSKRRWEEIESDFQSDQARLNGEIEEVVNHAARKRLQDLLQS